MNDIGDMLVDANNEGFKEGYQQGKAERVHDFVSWLQTEKKIDMKTWKIIDDMADEYEKEQTE